MLPEVEAEQVGAGKDDETEGLGRLGVNLRRRNWRQGLTGASRPDITGSEAIPLCESVAGGVECNGTPTDTVSRSWTPGFVERWTRPGAAETLRHVSGPFVCCVR